MPEKIIMTANRDEYCFRERANELASAALNAQLRIIQLFLPMAGWVAGRVGPDGWTVFAGHGVFDAGMRDRLLFLLEGNWEESGQPGVTYRLLETPERQALEPLLPALVYEEDYLVRAELPLPGHGDSGVLIGLCRHYPLATLNLGAGRLQRCIKAMALTLSLHAEFDTAELVIEEIRQDAYIDPLTGIYNRAGWIHRLAHIDAVLTQRDADAAIIMLDLDCLKMVNDTQGHAAGDELLRLTAQTITSVLRGTDAVGRLGGDEFGVVVQNATPMVAASLFKRLKQALVKVDVKISMGMALKSEGGSLKQTMVLADERMYMEKRKNVGPNARATWSNVRSLSEHAAAVRAGNHDCV